MKIPKGVTSWKLPKMRLPKLKAGVTTGDRRRWKKELGESWKWGEGGRKPTIR